MPDPRSAVWSAIAWDGARSLLAAAMHFARISRHAAVLGIEAPDDLAERVFEALGALEHPGEPNGSADQAAFLVRAGVRADGEIFVEPAVIRTWSDAPLAAISLAAPNWEEPVRGTKHAEWKPYRDARKTAIEHGADIGARSNSGATPLLRRRFELGLWQIAVPVSARISTSDSVSQTP